MRSLVCSALVLFALSTVTLGDDAPIRHRLMLMQYGGSNRIVELDADGKITWEFKPVSTAVMFQALPNGNVVYAYGGNPTGVMEVNRKGETVGNYVSKCQQVLACERLANGNTLVGEQGPCQAVEVDPKGNVVQTTKLTTSEEHFHRQLRCLHQLKDGHLLAAHEGEAAIREYDPSGSVVWEYKGVENTFEALRLANGNTLISGATQKRLLEVTPEGKIVWELKAEDAPELNLTWVTSLQVLGNGNYLVCNFLRGQEGKGAHAFEVTPQKKVVWKFADHDRFQSVTMVRAMD